MLDFSSYTESKKTTSYLLFGLCCKKEAYLLNLRKMSTRGTLMTEQHPFRWRHFQAEIILLCVVVSTLFFKLSGSRRDDAGAWAARWSHHHLPLGATLRARTGEVLSPPSQSDERFLACWWNVCEGEKGVDVPLSGRRFGRKHAGVPVQLNTRCSRRQTIFPKDTWSLSHRLPSCHNCR